VVRPYYISSAEYSEMDRVYRIVKEVAATSRSAQVGFRAAAEPPPSRHRGT